MGLLYLCPTPIGNLEDITLRTLKVLKEADLIAAEDTRHTRKLLNHYQVKTPLTSFHEHNKAKKIPVLLERLLAGETVALVSDAGMPGISDPGEELVREAIAHNIKVTALPGPSAVITALVASGLPPVPFTFLGFAPARGKKRKEFLAGALQEQKTVVFYEAPHRLQKMLGELAESDAERKVVVAREISKIHEEYVRGTVGEVYRHFSDREPQGECTVILAAADRPKKPREERSLEEVMEELLAMGLGNKEAAREAALRFGMSRREVYQRFFAKKNIRNR